MKTVAVVLEGPERLTLSGVELSPPGEEDVVVDIAWSGISTGTERLLWSGRMPAFPGMGYPLVPGYESVGRVREAGSRSVAKVGDHVFVPGARCFGEIRGLFGGAARHLVVSGAKVVPVDEKLGSMGVLLALAATAYHALASHDSPKNACELPDLIVGHGVLGRLLARITVALGGKPPTVWETNPVRNGGAEGYVVSHPDQDPRKDYRAVYDVSGDSAIIDTLVARLAPGGEIVLAGFYVEPMKFAFPPAFMREARIRVAAEWRPEDVTKVKSLVESGRLSLAGLITHCEDASQASAAYRTAFNDPTCLKMILDWRATA